MRRMLIRVMGLVKCLGQPLAVRRVAQVLVVAVLTQAAMVAQPTVAAVVNGASFQPSLSPGVMASAFGTNLNGTSLAVTVGGTNCPVIFASAAQLNVILPLSLPTGPANLVVSHDGQSSNAFPITLGAYSPAFFLTGGTGPTIAALTAGFRVISPSRPANGGDIVQAYLTGLGQTNPPAPIPPAPAPATPLYYTLATPAVNVGGNPATVLFSGLSPGIPSTYQVNFVVPPLTPAGNRTITLSIGSPPFTSQAGATLPVGCRDITSQVTVTRSGFVYNRALAKFVQSVQVVSQNPSLSLTKGTLVLGSLSPGVTLANAASAVCPPSDPGPNTGLTFGAGNPQTAGLVLQFSDPTFASISYGVRVLVP